MGFNDLGPQRAKKTEPIRDMALIDISKKAVPGYGEHKADPSTWSAP